MDCVKILLDVAKESSDWFPPLKSALGGVSALIKHYEVRVEGIVVAHDSHRPSQYSKDVKEKVEDLIIQLDSFRQNITTKTVDGDPEETNRRRGLIRYVYTLMTTRPFLTAIAAHLEKSRSYPRNCWRRVPPFGLWTRRRIPKR